MAIDKESAYPADLFDAFRDAGLLGLCIPPEYGGSGAGILGLALAIEEVAKYSNTAALMLLLTRLPTGPVMIAGTEEQKKRYLPGAFDSLRPCTSTFPTNWPRCRRRCAVSPRTR